MSTSKQVPESTRLPIDPLRGYVCLGVVVMHLYAGALRPQLQSMFGSAGEFAIAYLRLGVESFFVLAGYFLAHMIRPSADNYLSVPRLLGRRFLRLAIPYWVTIAAVVAAAGATNLALGRRNHVPVEDVLAAALFAQDVFGDRFSILYPLWSMATLFQFYIATVVVYWVTRRVCLTADPDRAQTRTRRVMIGLGFVVLLAGPAAAGAMPADGWQLPIWAGVLAIGALAYWRGEGLIGPVSFAAAVAWQVAAAVYCENTLYAKAAACAVLMVLIRRGLTFPNSLLTRALAATGRRSYSIYLAHGFIGLRVVNWSIYVPQQYRDHPAVVLGIVAAALAASIVAGCLLYRFVERPVAARAARIRYRR